MERIMISDRELSVCVLVWNPWVSSHFLEPRGYARLSVLDVTSQILVLLASKCQ